MASDGYLLSWGGSFGTFTFSIATAAFTKLARTDTWRWVTQERINNDPAEQYIGRGSKNITLEGVIYALYNPAATLGLVSGASGVVGTRVLDAIRFYADQGLPGTLVDGRGYVYGQWVLVGVKEEQSYFLVNGAPQKQAFGLEFRSYGTDGQVNDPNTIANNVAAAGAAAAAAAAAGFINPQVQDLSNVSAQTAQNASALINAGKSAQDARDIATFMNQVGQSGGKSVSVLIPQITTEVASTWGLNGTPLKAAVNDMMATFRNTRFGDISSVVNGGFPAMDQALSGLNVHDADAAVTQLSILNTLDPSKDRGAQMQNLATQLQAAQQNSALTSKGVNFNDPAVLPANRYSNGLHELNAFRSSDPTGFASALPANDNAELTQQMAAERSTEYGYHVSALSSSGLTGSPAPVAAGAH